MISHDFLAFHETPGTRSTLHQRWLELRDELGIVCNGQRYVAPNGVTVVGDTRLNATGGDLAAVAAAYHRWGSGDMLRHLDGDFSFVLWDANDCSVVAGRDVMGTIPLYYFALPDQCIVVSSQLPWLVRIAAPFLRLNDVAIADYLAFFAEDKQITFFDGIFRLPPGYCLQWRSGKTTVAKVVELQLPSLHEPHHGDDSYAESFATILTRSVERRIGQESAVGTFLSGGLDSSAITCIARDQRVLRSQSLPAFSFAFNHVAHCDERHYATAVAAAGGVDHQSVAMDGLDPLLNKDSAQQALVEPLFAPNLYMHLAVYRAAAKHGVSILLDGFDGDTTVSHGLRCLADLIRRGAIGTAYRQSQALSRFVTPSAAQILWYSAINPLVPLSVRRLYWYGRQYGGKRLMASEIMSARFARQIDFAGRLVTFEDRIATFEPNQHREHYLRITSGLIVRAFETFHHAASACGVRPRYPFFDPELIAFCLALPMNQKMRDGQTRIVLRNALRLLQAPAVIAERRRKALLGANLYASLVRSGNDEIDALLTTDGDLIAKFVNMALFAQVVRQCRARQATAKDWMILWRVLTLAQWLRRDLVKGTILK